MLPFWSRSNFISLTQFKIFRASWTQTNIITALIFILVLGLKVSDQITAATDSHSGEVPTIPRPVWQFSWYIFWLLRVPDVLEASQEGSLARTNIPTTPLVDPGYLYVQYFWYGFYTTILHRDPGGCELQTTVQLTGIYHHSVTYMGGCKYSIKTL